MSSYIEPNDVLLGPTPVAQPQRLNRSDQNHAMNELLDNAKSGPLNYDEEVGSDDDYSRTDRDQFIPHQQYLDSQLYLNNLDSEGKRRSISESSIYTKRFPQFNTSARIFMIISIISAVIVILLEVYILVMIHLHETDFAVSKYTEISMYVAIFVFAMIFQILLTYLGITTKNYLLIIMLLMFYGCMIIFCGIQYHESRLTLEIYMVNEDSKRLSIRIINIVMIGLTAILFLVQVVIFQFRLRKSLEFSRYYKIGANLKIRRMYNIFQIHRSLVIFEGFFFIGFLIQSLVIIDTNVNTTPKQFILTVTAFPVSLIILIMSDFATCREYLYLTIFTTCGFLLGLTFIIFKFVSIYTKYDIAYGADIIPGSYFPGRISLTIFAVVNIVLILISVIFEVLSAMNYDKGLKVKLSGYYHWRRWSKKREVGVTKDEMTEEIKDDQVGDNEYNDYSDDEISIN
ncbi:hypothetical protein DFJ63DRAFT_311531 [Scheffersomyces coipomensis]|uniref:uncharacterized protein n=1 Tax=Scheffersomyces coipomensis TaxID=1788519 RepID=UPI00315C7209